MKTLLLFFAFVMLGLIGLAQTTFVPDANFEAFLEANGMGDGIANNQLVTTANISGVTTLSADNLGIADLTGIEDFTALNTLYARNNAISTIAFSATQNMTEIRLSNNSISSVPGLQFQSNALIIELSNNPINSVTLDLTQNVNLNFLAIDSATLTSLNVRQNTLLTSLTAINNNLTFLDLSFNTVLTELEVFSNDPDLCIQVTDPAAANAGTGIYANWSKDPTAVYSLDCNPCEGNLLANGNFNAATCGGDAFGLGCVPNWSVANGTPTLGSYPANPYAWMWSYGTLGEAIAANFNFVAGTTYTISFRIRTDDLNTGCSIVANTATVNLVATNNAVGSIPVSGDEYIFSSLMGPYLNNWHSISVTYTPTANYSQLWVFPYMQQQNGQCQAELSIDDICIKEDVLGVEDVASFPIVLYPNPTQNLTNILVEEEATYSITNLQGRILYQGNLKVGNNTLDISYYSIGLYFINVKTKNGNTILKLIKE